MSNFYFYPPPYSVPPPMGGGYPPPPAGVDMSGGGGNHDFNGKVNVNVNGNANGNANGNGGIEVKQENGCVEIRSQPALSPDGSQVFCPARGMGCNHLGVLSFKVRGRRCRARVTCWRATLTA